MTSSEKEGLASKHKVFRTNIVRTNVVRTNTEAHTTHSHTIQDRNRKVELMHLLKRQKPLKKFRIRERHYQDFLRSA